MATNMTFRCHREPQVRRGVYRMAVWACASVLLLVVPAWPGERLPLHVVAGQLGSIILLAVLVDVLTAADSRRGFRLTSDGLCELFWFAPARLTAWHALQGVVVEERQATIHAEHGVIVLQPETVANWLELADRVQQVLGQTPAPPPATLGPHEIEGWLGLPAGGTLVCPRHLSGATVLRWLACGALAGLAALLPLLDRWTGPGTDALPPGARSADPLVRGLSEPLSMASMLRLYLTPMLLLGALGLSAATLTGLRLGLTRHELSGSGLWARGLARREWLPWAAVRAVEPQRWGWRVHTAREPWDIAVQGAARQALGHALQQVVLARQVGLVPPGHESVPPAALSKAVGSPTADRGLSPAEQELPADAS